MSLNNLQLPRLLIAELYKNSLIDYSNSKNLEGTIPSTTKVYKTLGSNARRFCIAVDNPGVAFLQEEELLFITRMLTACNLNLGDVAIINHGTEKINVIALKQQLQPFQILLFGIEPMAIMLPFNFTSFEPYEYENCTFLYAPPLADLNDETPEGKKLKRKLWDCLKTMFQIPDS